MRSALDEAKVLRSYGSKTYQGVLCSTASSSSSFCTATPSPNRCKELIHYAGFLSVRRTPGRPLTRFFQRDSTQANNLTLYPHKGREFGCGSTRGRDLPAATV